MAKINVRKRKKDISNQREKATTKCKKKFFFFAISVVNIASFFLSQLLTMSHCQNLIGDQTK